jgi:uncharacterized membrane protein YphA (DoxX/SURF4 family)
MNDLFFVGRLVFGGYFLYNGLNHFLSLAMLTQYAAAKGVPVPDLAVATTGLLLLVGGVSVLLGIWPQIGALCIVLFLAVVTPMMHNFWDIADPVQRIAEIAHFGKNVALLGGTLLMLGVPRPWPYSFERRRPITLA